MSTNELATFVVGCIGGLLAGWALWWKGGSLIEVEAKEREVTDLEFTLRERDDLITDLRATQQITEDMLARRDALLEDMRTRAAADERRIAALQAQLTAALNQLPRSTT